MTSTPAPNKYRVLVVDDDRSALDGIEAVLSQDVDVTKCLSPGRAIELLQERDFHVVCSDYRMPGIDGAELLRKVSELPQDVGCLLITGASEYVASSSTGKHYVLLKPFDPERLIRMVLQLARLAEMKRSVGALPSPHMRPRRYP
jgi:DNA-binding NtrC family response regulator